MNRVGRILQRRERVCFHLVLSSDSTFASVPAIAHKRFYFTSTAEGPSDSYAEDFRKVTEPILGWFDNFEGVVFEQTISCFDMGTAGDVMQTEVYVQAFEAESALWPQSHERCWPRRATCVRDTLCLCLQWSGFASQSCDLLTAAHLQLATDKRSGFIPLVGTSKKVLSHRRYPERTPLAFTVIGSLSLDAGHGGTIDADAESMVVMFGVFCGNRASHTHVGLL